MNIFFNKSSLLKQYEKYYEIKLNSEQVARLNNINSTYGFGIEEISYIVDNYPNMTPDNFDKLEYVCFTLKCAKLLTLDDIKKLILPKGTSVNKGEQNE